MEDYDDDYIFEEHARDGFWRLPDACSDNRLLAFIRQTSKAKYIDLDSPEVQNILCQRLRAVKTLEAAKAWKANYGMLWARVGAPDTLKLALTLRWIYRLCDLVSGEQTPLLKKHLCAESELSRAMLELTEEEYESTVAKLLAKEDVSTDLLMKTLRVNLNWDRPKKGHIKFSPDGIFNTEVHHVSFFGSVTTASVTDIFGRELEQDVRNIEEAQLDEPLLELAYNYFESLVRAQVTCLQLSVKKVKNDSGTRLRQTFSARYPWQAIVSAMLKDITGSAAPRKCANPNCSEKFIPKKSHQLFCPRPGCRKAASRQRANSE